MVLKSLCLAAVLLLETGNVLVAEDLDIYKFKEVDNGKNYGKPTPAKIVYIRADGSEGQKEDAGVAPAIKVELSPMPKTSLVGVELMAQIDHLVMQDKPATVSIEKRHTGVDVWASPDFKRVLNNDPNSKVGTGDFNGYLMSPPDMDFWIISSHHTFFSELKPGSWTHVESSVAIAYKVLLEFHVPPGTGYVYLKNFVAKP